MTNNYYLWTLAYVVILNFLYVVVALFLWYHIWLKDLGVEIPIEKKVAGLDRRQLFYNTRSPSILFDFFKGMLTKFSKDYWTTQCGQDAYLYLLFQRKIMKMVAILGASSIIVSLCVNLFMSNDQAEWFYRSALDNKSLTPITIWIHCGIAFLGTVLAFYTVFELREEARQLYKESQIEKCKAKDFEWLKARTLHVRGLISKDRRGDMLRNELNLMLQPVNGKVLDLVVIPDYQRLFDLEVEKKDLEDWNHLVAAHGKPGCVTRNCFKAMWTGRQGVRERLGYLEQQIQGEIEKPFLSSGHAFVVLDSVKSLNFCLQQSKMTPTYAWRLAKVSVTENVQTFFKNRMRSISEKATFNKFEDEDLEIAQGYRAQDLTLVMSEASDPCDIVWRNMGGTRGIYLFRQIIFNLIGLFVVLFLSTPAAIFSSLKMMQLFSFLNVTKAPGGDLFMTSGSFIATFLPPLVIICINSLLLYMIDYSAFWEKHVTHSRYQYSIFSKAYVYLLLNMLIIPAVTLTSQSSIIEVISVNNFNIFEVFAKFYETNSGVFFVSMLVQNACLSLCTNLVRPGEISVAFFSPWLAHYRRKYVNDSQAWRRREGMVFLYGFYYAQHLVIFTIIMIFASSVPMVAIGGFLFFGMRHVIDSYNLLTNNRKEIDSSCKMFQKILLNFQVAILLLQICLLSYLGTNGYLSGACFMALLFLISLLIVGLTNKSLFDSSKHDQSIFNEDQNAVIVDLQAQISDNTETTRLLQLPLLKWRNEYSHPLMINNSAEELMLPIPQQQIQQESGNNSFVGQLPPLPPVTNTRRADVDQRLKEMIFASSGTNSNNQTGRGDISQRQLPVGRLNHSGSADEVSVNQMNHFASNTHAASDGMIVVQAYNNGSGSSKEMGKLGFTGEDQMLNGSTEFNSSASNNGGANIFNQ